MPINRRILSQDAAVAAGGGDAADGLIMHLDANDEDSIESGGANTGSGSGTWFDISSHDLNIPRIAPSTNLILDLDFSNTASYSGSGTNVEDVSENNPEADGTINGSGTFASDTRGYYEFGAQNSNFISVGSVGDYSTTTDKSFEVWVYPEGSGEEMLFSTSFTSTNVGYVFGIVNTGSSRKWNVSDRPTGGHAQSTESEFIQDAWQHVVLTWDASTKNWQIFVNGTLSTGSVQQGGNPASTPTDSTDNLRINSVNTGYAFGGWTGKFNSLRIYDRILTPSEVAQNFRANCFLSFSSIYSTDLAIHLDAADDTTVSATTWSDKANSNNATIGSSVGFSSTLSDYYDKELGNWLVLDGSDDNMTIASNSSFQNATAFTVEMWIEPISIADNEMLSTLYTSGSDFKWDLRFNSASGDIRWGVANSSGAFASSQDIITTDTLSTGNWHHLVATYDDSANTQKIFFNGIEVKAASSPTAGTRTGGSDDIDIGHRVGSFEANIKIGQYRLYNTSLTSAQVAQNYLATKNDYPNGINGDIQGPTFQGSATPYHFDFNGSTNYVDVAYTTLGDRDFTVTMYIKFDDLTAQRYIFTKYMANPSGQYGMLIQSQASASEILWQMYDTGNHPAISLNSSTSLSTGTYYHLAFVYVHRTSATIYVDGSSDGTTSWSTGNPFGQNSAQVRFARYQSTTTSLDGEIGQIKIFDKALSSSEVTAEYDATKTPYS